MSLGAGYLYAMAYGLLGLGRAVGLAHSQAMALRCGVRVRVVLALCWTAHVFDHSYELEWGVESL